MKGLTDFGKDAEICLRGVLNGFEEKRGAI